MAFRDLVASVASEFNYEPRVCLLCCRTLHVRRQDVHLQILQQALHPEALPAGPPDEVLFLASGFRALPRAQLDHLLVRAMRRLILEADRSGATYTGLRQNSQVQKLRQDFPAFEQLVQAQAAVCYVRGRESSVKMRRLALNISHAFILV